jgi:hypothetical protein
MSKEDHSPFIYKDGKPALRLGDGRIHEGVTYASTPDDYGVIKGHVVNNEWRLQFCDADGNPTHGGGKSR